MTTRRTDACLVSAAALATGTLCVSIISALVFGAAAGLAEPVGASPRQVTGVHQLPRVVITGQVQHTRVAKIIDLPRVVVTVRRSDNGDALLTQAQRKPTPNS